MSAGSPPPSTRRRRFSWTRSRSRCCWRASWPSSAWRCPRAPTTRSPRRPATSPTTGPDTPPEWGGGGKTPGAGPFTIGLESVALIVAATRLTGPDQALALALADNWNEPLEEFTYVSGDELNRALGPDGHYPSDARAG